MMRTDTDEEKAPADEGFGSRWSRRKLDAQEQQQDLAIQPQTEYSDEKPVLTDADMPPIDSLTEDSDYSGFLSPEVSEELRKQALRRLFLGSGFNVCDGLDDYDEDYTSFAKLGDIVTADMRHQMEMEARKRLALDDDGVSHEEIPVVEQTASNEEETHTALPEENQTDQQLVAEGVSERHEIEQEKEEL
jgi:hypothetical protein